MARMILAGGGDASDSKPLDDLFVSLLQPKKILYIPLAWKTGDFNCCKEWFSSIFDDFEMWIDLHNKTAEDVERFGGIYIGGGNTFSLLHDLRTTGFDKLLLLFLDSGKPIYGGSAGAIIFGSSIKTASLGKDSDSNDVGLKDLSGFNIVQGYSIQCHYEEGQDDELKELSRHQKIIALSERSGIIVDDIEIKVIGFDAAYVFRHGEKIEYNVGSIVH